MNIKSTLWRYYVFCFLKNFAFFGAVLIPFYTVWAKMSLSHATILQSWFSLWIFFLEVPTGAVADYLGRKYSLALGAFVVMFGALLYGSIPNFVVFLIAEFLFAIGFALISGADEALLYDALLESGKAQEAAKYSGRAYSFHMLGILIAAPIGSMIASKFGLNAPMLASALPYFLATLVALSIKEPKLHSKTSESKRYMDIVTTGFKYFKNHTTLRWLAFDGVMVYIAAYFVIWLNQALLLKLNVPISYFGYTQAILVAVEMLIAANFVRLEKLFGSTKNYLRFAALITGLSFFLVALVPSFITALILIIFAGGFGLTRMRLMTTYMNRFIHSERRATVLSSVSMFQRFALAACNPLIGLLADRSLGMTLFLIGLLPMSVFLFSPLQHRMFSNEDREK